MKTRKPREQINRDQMAAFIAANNADPKNEVICDDLDFWRDECKVKTLTALKAWIEPMPIR